MFSVICAYNDKKILDDWLGKSLKSQSVAHEFIAIDNTQGEFKSAAKALNHGASRATNKYLLFAHQDIDLTSNNWLAEAEKTLDALPNLGVAGVAGRTTDKSGNFTNIKDGVPPRWAAGHRIDLPTKVQTVDECLFIAPKPVFEKLKFDEITCNNWHLYATEYCLSAGELELDVFVLPLALYHKSAGNSFSNKYFTTLKNILKKHKKSYKTICSPYGRWNPLYPLTLQRLARTIKKHLYHKS